VLNRQEAEKTAPARQKLEGANESLEYRRKTEEESDEQVAVVRQRAQLVPSVPVRRWGDAALPPNPPSEIGSTKDPAAAGSLGGVLLRAVGLAGWGSLASDYKGLATPKLSDLK